MSHQRDHDAMMMRYYKLKVRRVGDCDFFLIESQLRRLSGGLTLCTGRAMAQVVSRRPITAEARVRARVNPCGICCGQSGTGTELNNFRLLLLINCAAD
jgi:hypothetical protein